MSELIQCECPSCQVQFSVSEEVLLGVPELSCPACGELADPEVSGFPHKAEDGYGEGAYGGLLEDFPGLDDGTDEPGSGHRWLWPRKPWSGVKVC